MLARSQRKNKTTQSKTKTKTKQRKAKQNKQQMELKSARSDRKKQTYTRENGVNDLPKLAISEVKTKENRAWML